MNIKSIIAITDFSSGSEAALMRAALLAKQHGAGLCLAYRRGTRAAMVAEPTALLGLRARQIGRRFGTEVLVSSGMELSAESIRSLTEDQDLLVVHSFDEGMVARMLKMTAVDKALRDSQCPVLFVRGGGHTAYQRVVAAVDFSELSRQAVTVGAALTGEAFVELFHVVSVRDETKLRSAEVSTAALFAYRGHVLRRAGKSMAELTRELALPEGRTATFIGRGDPARQAVVRQKAVHAGLVIVGRRRQSVLVDVVAGSVAHHVLRWGTSDVLVVPAGVGAGHVLSRRSVQGERQAVSQKIARPA